MLLSLQQWLHNDDGNKPSLGQSISATYNFGDPASCGRKTASLPEALAQYARPGCSRHKGMPTWRP